MLFIFLFIAFIACIFYGLYLSFRFGFNTILIVEHESETTDFFIVDGLIFDFYTDIYVDTAIINVYNNITFVMYLYYLLYKFNPDNFSSDLYKSLQKATKVKI